MSEADFTEVHSHIYSTELWKVYFFGIFDQVLQNAELIQHSNDSV